MIPDPHYEPSPDLNAAGTRIRSRLGVLTPAETAAALGVTTRTLDTWRTEKRGPDFVRAGGRVFYREADLGEWLALNAVVTRRTA